MDMHPFQINGFGANLSTLVTRTSHIGTLWLPFRDKNLEAPNTLPAFYSSFLKLQECKNTTPMRKNPPNSALVNKRMEKPLKKKTDFIHSFGQVWSRGLASTHPPCNVQSWRLATVPNQDDTSPAPIQGHCCLRNRLSWKPSLLVWVFSNTS